ncbi:MAG: caspase family protein [Bacteroidota bacterium]
MAEKITYRYKDFFLPQGQMSGSEHRRLWNFYKRYCLEMGDYYGEGHWILLCHAAFPVLITPDLLYKIWMNFSAYPSREPAAELSHTIPYVAVSDLLLSSICEEVGFEQFEIPANIRFALLEWLTQDHRFCDPMPEDGSAPPEDRLDRVSELAEFLSAYLEDSFNGSDPQSEAFREAQKWAITSYFQPDTAIRNMYEEFLDANIHNNKRKQLRLNRTIEQLQRQYSLRIQVNPNAEQAQKLEHLLEYSRGSKNLLMGRTQEAIAAFRKLPSLKDAPSTTSSMVNKTLSFPAAIGGEAIRSVSEDDYDGEQIYAMLVGIDTYEDPAVTPLSSCVKDTHAIGEYLRKHHFEKDLRILKLTNEEATYERVVESFRTHFRRARSEDVILFYFAGHSNFFPPAPEFISLFDSGKESGLVLHDSRQDGTRMLTNLELIALLADSVKDDRNPTLTQYPRVVLIFDTDHSEETTQVPSIKNITPTASSSTEHVRPLSSYLDGHYQQQLTEDGKISFPEVPYLLLGAAGEGTGAGETPDGGIFTQQLLQLLTKRKGQLSYAEIFNKIKVKVQASRDQIPIMIPYGGFDVNLGFLDKKVDASQLGQQAHVFFDRQTKKWKLGAGALHGFTRERFGDQELSILAGGIILASFQFKDIGLTESEITIQDPRLPLEQEEIYEVDIPTYPLHKVFTNSDIKKYLRIIDHEIQWVDQASDAEWIIEFKEDQYWITGTADPVYSYSLGLSPSSIEKVLGHIALWTWIKHLENPSSYIHPDLVELSLERVDSNGYNSPLDNKEGMIELDLNTEESCELLLSAKYEAADQSNIYSNFGDIFLYALKLTNDFAITQIGMTSLGSGEASKRVTEKAISFSLSEEGETTESFIKCFYSMHKIDIQAILRPKLTEKIRILSR